MGDRPERYKIFESEEECISKTKVDSDNGNYDGGYIGPLRPLCYYKIPMMEIPSTNFINKLEFKSDLIYIK